MHELFSKKRTVDKVKEFGVAAGVATASFLFAVITVLIMIVAKKGFGVLVPLLVIFVAIFVVSFIVSAKWNPFCKCKKPEATGEQS